MTDRDLHAVFSDYLDRYWASGRGPDVAEAGHAILNVAEGKSRPLHWLLGRLWDDAGKMDPGTCDLLALPHGATYAEAARKVARVTGKSLASYREWYLFVRQGTNV